MNRFLLICLLGTACAVLALRGADTLPEGFGRLLRDCETAW